jgi:hypothetical protein
MVRAFSARVEQEVVREHAPTPEPVVEIDGSARNVKANVILQGGLCRLCLEVKRALPAKSNTQKAKKDRGMSAQYSLVE